MPKSTGLLKSNLSKKTSDKTTVRKRQQILSEKDISDNKFGKQQTKEAGDFSSSVEHSSLGRNDSSQYVERTKAKPQMKGVSRSQYAIKSKTISQSTKHVNSIKPREFNELHSIGKLNSKQKKCSDFFSEGTYSERNEMKEKNISTENESIINILYKQKKPSTSKRYGEFSGDIGSKSESTEHIKNNYQVSASENTLLPLKLQTDNESEYNFSATNKLDNNEEDDYASDFHESSSVSSKAEPYSLECSPIINSNHSCGTFECVSTLRSYHNLNQTDFGSNRYKNGLIDFAQGHNRVYRQIQYRLNSRAENLLNLVTLSFDQTVSAFEIMPLDEYSIQLLSYGKENKEHCQTQTNEDALDREVQTDEIDVCSDGIWTQHPSDEHNSSCGKTSSCNSLHSNLLNSNKKFAENEDPTKYDELMKEFFMTDELNLIENTSSIFSQISSNLPNYLFENESLEKLLNKMNLMINLLDEKNKCVQYDSKSFANHNNLSLFQFNHIRANTLIEHNYNDDHEHADESNNTISILSDYECVACNNALNNDRFILTLHKPIKGSLNHQDLTDRRGFTIQTGEIVCIWRIMGQNDQPVHILYCPGLSEAGLNGANITCALFSPDSEASMVIGGLHNGTICLWDLRNQPIRQFGYQKHANSDFLNSQHRLINNRNIISTIALAPTYLTSVIEFENHLSCLKQDKSQKKLTTIHHYESIISIKLMNSIRKSGSDSISASNNTDTVTSRSNNKLTKFQFVALDHFGNLTLWLVIAKPKFKIQNSIEFLAGSQTDFGLRPGGLIQLIRLLVIDTYLPPIKSATILDKSLSFVQPDYEVITQDFSNKLSENPLYWFTDHSPTATALDVTNQGNFIIGFNDGSLIQKGRSVKQFVYPKQFHRPLSCAAVQCLNIHPNSSISVMVVGYSDGMVLLYKLNCPQPIYSWNISHNFVELCVVRKLLWSSIRCSVFFSLDSKGRVMIWEMLKLPNIPNSILIPENDQLNPNNTKINDENNLKIKSDFICDMSLISTNRKSSSSGTKQSNKFTCNSNCSTLNSSLLPSIVLLTSNGARLDRIETRWIQQSSDELNAFNSILNNNFNNNNDDNNNNN